MALATSGHAAVERSVGLALIAEGRRDDRSADSGARLLVQRFGDRVLLLVGGVWVDRNFTPAMKGKERRIEAFSDDYFALLQQHPELNRTMAFSTRLVLVVDGEAIEIVPPAE